MHLPRLRIDLSTCRRPVNSCKGVATLLAVLLPAVALGIEGSQPAARSPSTTPSARLVLSRVSEPPELKGMPTPSPVIPSPVDLALANSKALQAAKPESPTSVVPAIKELSGLIAQDPTRSDLYFLRANLSCYVHADPAAILEDLKKSIALYQPRHSAFENLAGHYALRSKISFDAGRYADAMSDIDLAVAQNYDDASEVFNDGKVDPSRAARPCVWTLADLDVLSKHYPADSRPSLYRGLYLSYFTRYHTDSDFREVLSAFEHAGKLAPASALPHFYTGRLYVFGGLGGVFSMVSARCLDNVVPRTAECLKLDEAHEEGVRELTIAVAIDPTFSPAYDMRAEGFTKLKSYRQAIRDYDKSLDLETPPHNKSFILNDRALAKMKLGLYMGAIADLTLAIEMGCETNVCGSYANRADAYANLHDYKRAIEDLTVTIRQNLNSSFLMGIEQFRRIYPEYDSVSDDVLCDLLRRRLFSQMSYANFAAQFLIADKGFESFIIADLYIKRGDWYAKLGKRRVAHQDYDRAINSFPEYAKKVAFTQVNGNWIRNHE